MTDAKAAYVSCLDLRCTACGYLGREHGNHDESGDTWDDDAPSQDCTGWFVTYAEPFHNENCTPDNCEATPLPKAPSEVDQ